MANVIIETSMSDGCVDVRIAGEIFTRKIYIKKKYNYTLVNGFKIYFNNNFEVLKVEEAYSTKGITRHSTNVKNIDALKYIKNTEPKTTKSNIVEKIKTEIKNNDLKISNISKSEKIDTSIKHEKYEIIKNCLLSNIPVYLTGPAGSGKNYTIEQIAKELDWDFYFSNSVQQEYKLTGFIDAGGRYHETEFYKACTACRDCVFFLDEMDASIPEVLVLLNAAIANGYFEFPTGRVDLSHVHFISAGNTVGSGADEMYTGRMVIDSSTLDRFAIIDFDYDEKIELAITGNNEELCNFIREVRQECNNQGIRATFSYRCLTMATKLEKTNMDLETILKIVIFKGLDIDTIKTISLTGKDKYCKALENLQKVA